MLLETKLSKFNLFIFSLFYLHLKNVNVLIKCLQFYFGNVFFLSIQAEIFPSTFIGKIMDTSGHRDGVILGLFCFSFTVK